MNSSIIPLIYLELLSINDSQISLSCHYKKKVKKSRNQEENRMKILKAKKKLLQIFLRVKKNQKGKLMRNSFLKFIFIGIFWRKKAGGARVRLFSIIFAILLCFTIYFMFMFMIMFIFIMNIHGYRVCSSSPTSFGKLLFLFQRRNVDSKHALT